DEALDACVATANFRRYEGIGEYIDLGYIPDEKNGTSVSNTLEYAYDDWCIAQLAKHLGRGDIYETFLERSENWRNMYDPTIGFMRRSEEHTSELQSRENLVCRLLLA